jgi:hypothetical protein
VAVAFTAAVEADSTAAEGSVAAVTAAGAATAERATTVVATAADMGMAVAIAVDTDIAAGMATEADTTAAGAAVMVMAGGATGGVDIGATRVTDGVGRNGGGGGDIPIIIMVITAIPATIRTTTIVRRVTRARTTETMAATRNHLRIPTRTAARIVLQIQEFIPGDLQRLPTRKHLRRTILITMRRPMDHGRLLFPLIT